MIAGGRPGGAAPPRDPSLVAHSLLNGDFLAREVERRYALDGAVQGQLLYRGMNDVYALRDQSGRQYALRAWRTAWRSLDDVAYELALLDFLKGEGIAAAYPVHACDGSSYFVLEAAEGVRPIALYDWSPGVKFSKARTEETARRIGRLFARMHLAALRFQPAKPRFNAWRAADLDNLPYLDAVLADRPEDRKLCRAIAEGLVRALPDLVGQKSPRGTCHGDFHPSNVHVTPHGTITLLDFDGAGEDFWMQDVMNFVFGNDFYGFEAAHGRAFMDGYGEVRAFTADEMGNAELFLLAKTFRLLTGFARNIPSVGQGLLSFRDLDWFSRELRRRGVALGMVGA